MQHMLLLIAALTVGQTDPIGAGDHQRRLTVDGRKRSHWIHVPPRYDPKQPPALVLALHGAAMNDKMMEGFSGLSKSADEHNFVVVYPNGTGFIQTWNAGLFPGNLNKERVDDIRYLQKVLDDVEGAVNVNKKRVYATGMSNGGMMCYRVAAEMADRIAAIAPVAGTLALEKYEPKRPIPVIHLHGTKDTFVPFDGFKRTKEAKMNAPFRSVDDTIQACVNANGCAAKPTETVIEVKDEKLRIVRRENASKTAPVVLYVIEEGGHVWPGIPAPTFLGQSTTKFAANEVIWQFFQQHELK